jgi:hypothetical protein
MPDNNVGIIFLWQEGNDFFYIIVCTKGYAKIVDFCRHKTIDN